MSAVYKVQFIFLYSEAWKFTPIACNARKENCYKEVAWNIKILCKIRHREERSKLTTFIQAAHSVHTPTVFFWLLLSNCLQEYCWFWIWGPVTNSSSISFICPAWRHYFNFLWLQEQNKCVHFCDSPATSQFTNVMKMMSHQSFCTMNQGTTMKWESLTDGSLAHFAVIASTSAMIRLPDKPETSNVHRSFESRGYANKLLTVLNVLQIIWTSWFDIWINLYSEQPRGQCLWQ